MADPAPYTVSYSFAGWQAVNPSRPLPAARMDNEFANIEAALGSTNTALTSIRRSDGKLQNGVVTYDSLDTSLRTGISVTAPTAWETGATYTQGRSSTFDESLFYICAITHEAGASFAADVAAGRWTLISDFGSPVGAARKDQNLSDLADVDVARNNIGAIPAFIKVEDPPQADLCYFKIAPAAVTSPRHHMFIRQETAKRNDEFTVQIQRVVTTNDNYVSPRALQVITYIQGGGGSQREWALSGVVENSDNGRTGEGGVGTSGVAVKKAAGTGVMFGGHFQARDETGLSGGSIVGAEVNIVCSGAHTGSRIGIDVIAKTYEPGPSMGYGFAGIRIRGESIAAEEGTWEYGLLVANSTTPIERAIGVRNSPGLSVGAAFDDEGTKQYGILLKGTYGAAAIRMNAGQAIAFDATAAIRMQYDSSVLALGIYNGSNRRFRFETDPTPVFYVNDVAVVRERRTGWVAPTGTSSRDTFDPSTVTLSQLATRVKALIDDLTAHGLIGS
jgi:hypothetical protein